METIFDFTKTTFDAMDTSNIQPRSVSISWTGVTDTSLTCEVIGFSVVDYGRYVDWYVNNSYYGTTNISANSTNCPSITFRGLSPGTTYSIGANIYKTSNDEYLWGGSRNLTTTENPSDSKPSLWHWSQAELNAFNNNGPTDILLHQRWNAFVEKVKKFDKWKNGSNSGQYYLDDALMTSNDKTLTAYKFNVIRQSIGGMASNGSGISAVNSGDRVYGWYFIQLAERLNNITK
ncbi:MAG: fibronectin type III domain-containing protein [Clostridium sp.]